MIDLVAMLTTTLLKDNTALHMAIRISDAAYFGFI